MGVGGGQEGPQLFWLGVRPKLRPEAEAWVTTVAWASLPSTPGGQNRLALAQSAAVGNVAVLKGHTWPLISLAAPAFAHRSCIETFQWAWTRILASEM